MISSAFSTGCSGISSGLERENSVEPEPAISGTPTAAGQFSFTAHVAHSSSPVHNATKTFSIRASIAESTLTVTAASGESVWAPVGQCGRGGWEAPLMYFRDLVENGVGKQDEQAALYNVLAGRIRYGQDRVQFLQIPRRAQGTE